jgi:hypothetical protein
MCYLEESSPTQRIMRKPEIESVPEMAKRGSLMFSAKKRLPCLIGSPNNQLQFDVA